MIRGKSSTVVLNEWKKQLSSWGLCDELKVVVPAVILGQKVVTYSGDILF